MKKLASKILIGIKTNRILTVVLIIAAILRFIGIYPGYHPYHSDEGMSYSSAIEMIRNLNIDPGRYDYPALIPLINAIIYTLILIPLFLIKNLLLSPDDWPTKGQNLIELWQQVVIQNQQTVVMFWGRFVTAVFGVGVIFLVYQVAKSFFQDKRIGLVVAFLLAVNFRQVLNSHLGLPDIYNAFFLLLSLWAFALLLKKPNFRNYLFSGITIALYFSIKYQVFTLPAFILIHSWIVWKKTKDKKILKLILNFFDRNLLLSLAVIPVIILLLNPYHLIHWDKFKAINSYNVFKYGVGAKVLNFYSISYLYHIGIGKLASLSILMGIIFGLRKYPFKSIILLSSVLIFLFLLAYYTRGGYYTRNFVTLTPLLLVFAAVFLVAFWDYLGKRIKLNKTFINFCLAATVIFISLDQTKNSLAASYYFSKPWGFELAHNWAEINIPQKSNVVSHPWDKYPRDKELNIISLETSSVFSLAEMREEGADFGFINMDWLTLGSYWWMNRSTKESLEFWEKPDGITANTYSAVVAQELANFAVAKFVKPWQAPDMNFLIVKIPPVIKIKEKVLISEFSFDKKEDLSPWYLIDGDWGEAKKILFDASVGRNSSGSLKFESAARRLPVVRVVSPAFPVGDNKENLNSRFAQNKAVVVEGWIKSGSILDKKARDGVLRIDFYKDNPGEINLTTKSLQSNVSSRFFGAAGWGKKEISVVPPRDARFMTVGVQINNYVDFWFDDIVVYQSKEFFEGPRENAPYIDYQIPNDILFPYSQGGL